MSAAKTLFLFTKDYPYGSGEAYVHNELEYLAAAFDRVIIYPNDYYKADVAHHRHLPANVEVLNFNQTLYGKASKATLADYAYLLKMTVQELFASDDKKFFFKNFKWNLINFWTQHVLAKHFATYLAQNKEQLGKATFYSYWFHKSAILLSILKDKGHISGYVSRAHSIDLYHNRWSVINNEVIVPPFKMFKLKHASKVMSISKHGERYLKTHFPAYKDKIETIYLGVTALPDAPEKFREPYFHIVTCSSLTESKRVHRLAEALRSIEAPVKWVHFGDGALMPQLKELVRKLPANIQADLRGAVPNVEVRRYYAATHVDLFVNLSVVEGLPVSIMEAMSSGIPALATAVYGTPEAVIDGDTGFLLDVGCTDAELTAKLNYCIQHPELLKEMGVRARQLYLDVFSAEKNFTFFANYLKSV